jgi:hypothetical protein
MGKKIVSRVFKTIQIILNVVFGVVILVYVGGLLTSNTIYNDDITRGVMMIVGFICNNLLHLVITKLIENY